MYFNTIISGFGGQGVMFMGNLLAYAAMKAGRQVTYMPVYGVEMRGGTANCTVVISDKPVGSPIVHKPVSAVVMNNPSAEKFGPMVKKNCLLLVNSSLVEHKYVQTRTKRILSIPSLQLANEVGNSRLANMVMLGALVQISGLVEVEQVVKCLPEVLDPRYHKMISVNSAALRRGADVVTQG
ncbi:2-oxoglutarate ferredoxin oxidoreductase subunit gamma [Desulfarculales bacterium]